MINHEHIIAFALGLGAKWVFKTVQQHVLSWKFERDFKIACQKCNNCSHETKIMVDIGLDAPVEKCVICWALHIDNHGWNPNMAPPESYERKDGFGYFQVKKHKRIL